VAAGGGERFGAEPKQFVPLRGRPVIVWAVGRLADRQDIHGITLVVADEAKDRVGRLVEKHGLTKVDRVVSGGETRQHSVWNGLQALDSDCDTVLVHDAARPCLSSELLDRILNALAGNDAVIPVLRAVDTLVHEKSGRLDAILDRVNISGVQTPQGFRKELLTRAHRHAEAKGIISSDDGSLVFALGEPVATVGGSRTNIKITFEEDVPIAEAIIELQKTG
jgi:2-C-methyl-D-erythritol 4-phosphate cytidylyltransferase